MIKNFSFSLSYFYSTLITMWDRALSRREIKRSYSSYRLLLILRAFLFTSRREENMEQRFFEIWSTFLIIRQIKRRISENNDKIYDESTLPIFPFFSFSFSFFFFMCVHVQDDMAGYRGVGSERKSSKQFCQALKYKRAGPLLSRMMALNIHFARRPLCITSRLLLCLRNFYP